MTEVVAFGALFLALAAPVVLVIVLFRVALRRFSGRRGRYDSLLEGMGRAAGMYAHLSADMPHPDDIAVPKPETVPPDGARRRHRRRQRDVRQMSSDDRGSRRGRDPGSQ